MTYLEEAYRRFKLPISVSYEELTRRDRSQRIIKPGCWVIEAPIGHRQVAWCYDYPAGVTSAYLAAVKELSHD